MPINAYTGLMGSGKSYESVVSVIIPAILQGRTVVTNVDGIDGDAIRAYCVEKHKADIDKLGNVKHCQNDDVHKADFLPHGKDIDTFCQPGDIVVIDEAWRFWGTDCKLLNEHKIFFREHRHYVHPVTKVSCDLVLMVQDIGDLNRILRVVVEVSFRTTKMKSLGLSKMYRVEMWEGYKLTQKAKVSTENKFYEKEIFPLYSSYSGGQGKEVQVDSRQNILKNKTLWAMIAFLLCSGSYAVYWLYDFFHPPVAAAAAKTGSGTFPANFGTNGANAAAASSMAVSSPLPGFSERWRYAGTYIDKNGQAMAIIADGAGRLRVESPSVFTNKGYAALGMVDGQRVTIWTGQEPRTGSEAKK